MRIRITLAQLEAFAEVARAGSFRAAAQTLNVSQPALSRTIKIVEGVLEVRLFDRDTRHVEVTPAGKELLPIALRILENFNSSFSELSQFLEGRAGHVTVAALPSVGVALLSDAVAAFIQQRPQVQFAFLEGPAAFVRAAIADGRADFGISVRPDPQDSLEYQHLIDDPFVLLCRRDDAITQRSSASWSAFAERPFIGSGLGSSIRPVTDAVFLQKRLRITPTMEASSIAAAGALVAAGLGLTALPKLALHLIRNDELTSIPLQRPTMSRAIGLVTRVGRSLSPVARDFMHAIKQRSPTLQSPAAKKPAA